MSPEANKPENKNEITTDHHPEGVRPFTADLAEVHDKLELPDDVSAIDPVTGNVEFDRISETAAPYTDGTESYTQPVPTEKSKLKTWTARIVGGAILAGGGFAAASTLSGDDKAVEPESPRSTASATVTPGENQVSDSPEKTAKPETSGESLIADLKKKPTSEQIQYVIDNPVNIADFPTAGLAIGGLGDRWNVMANSGVIDYSLSTPDQVVFTTDDESKLELMSGSVLDVTSPNYTANLESIHTRRAQIAAMFEAQSDAESEVNFEAVNNAEAPLQKNATVELDVNTIWTTNVPDTQSADGKYNNDYRSHMTLSVDAAGNVHVYSSRDGTDIGNIG